MICVEHQNQGKCMSCKSDEMLYKITAESGLSWSLLLCAECIEKLKIELEKCSLPREFKCQVGHDDSCNTCKYKKREKSECSDCLKVKCPIDNVEGSCNRCEWAPREKE